MSSVFLIKASKDSESKGVMLFELSTTPARNLDLEVPLKYNQWTVVTKDFLKDVIDYYNSFIEQGNKSIEECKARISKYNTLLPKCENMEIFNSLENNIFENEADIKEWVEDLDFMKHCLSLILNIDNFLDENIENGFNLYYYFA